MVLLTRMIITRNTFICIVIGCLLFCGCADSSVQTPNMHVSETGRYSIRNTFHIESSGSYPDSLAPLFPNPFNRTTGDSIVTLFFTLKDTGTVKILIQNPIGDSIAIFVDSLLPPGSFTDFWHPVTANGTRLHAGLYFITMHAAPDDFDRNYISSRLLQIQSNE